MATKQEANTPDRRAQGNGRLVKAEFDLAKKNAAYVARNTRHNRPQAPKGKK